MVGIGAQISDEFDSEIKLKLKSPRYVAAVPEGSSAHIAGLKAGDLILEVNCDSRVSGE